MMYYTEGEMATTDSQIGSKVLNPESYLMLGSIRIVAPGYGYTNRPKTLAVFVHDQDIEYDEIFNPLLDSK